MILVVSNSGHCRYISNSTSKRVNIRHKRELNNTLDEQRANAFCSYLLLRARMTSYANDYMCHLRAERSKGDSMFVMTNDNNSGGAST